MWDTKWYVVSGYIVPGDEETVVEMQKRIEQRPVGFKVLLLGDLNVSLKMPMSTREDAIANMADKYNLTELTRHYKQWGGVRGGRGGKCWSWRQRRRGRWVASQPDYVLAEQGDNKLFSQAAFRLPRWHDSDHRMITTRARVRGRGRLRAYRRKLQRNPLIRRLPPSTGNLKMMEDAFESL